MVEERGRSRQLELQLQLVLDGVISPHFRDKVPTDQEGEDAVYKVKALYVGVVVAVEALRAEGGVGRHTFSVPAFDVPRLPVERPALARACYALE